MMNIPFDFEMKNNKETLFVTRDEAFADYLEKHNILPIKVMTNRSEDYYRECTFVMSPFFTKYYEEFYKGGG